LFAVEDRSLRPRLGAVEGPAAALLVRRGALFLVLSLAIAVGYQSDAVVVSRYLGAQDVADFAVALRLFMVAPNLVWLGVAPLWPAYTEAVARDDVDWAHRTFLRSLAAAAAVTAAASAVLLVAAGPVVGRVVDTDASPGTGLLLAFGAWAVVSGVSTAVSAFLNAMGVLRLQAAASAAMAVANIVLSIVLVGAIGVEGPVLASVATQTVLVLLPCAWVLRSVLHPTATSDSLRTWARRWSDVAPPVQEGVAPARR
jgi:O-antigen/teichoic acid export membrane protein